MKGVNFHLRPSGPEFGKFLKEASVDYAKLIKELNIKID